MSEIASVPVERFVLVDESAGVGEARFGELVLMKLLHRTRAFEKADGVVLPLLVGRGVGDGCVGACVPTPAEQKQARGFGMAVAKAG